jgi:hypothetical protein
MVNNVLKGIKPERPIVAKLPRPVLLQVVRIFRLTISIKKNVNQWRRPCGIFANYAKNVALHSRPAMNVHRWRE